MRILSTKYSNAMAIDFIAIIFNEQKLSNEYQRKIFIEQTTSILLQSGKNKTIDLSIFTEENKKDA